jgi:hypothetical protein
MWRRRLSSFSTTPRPRLTGDLTISDPNISGILIGASSVADRDPASR